MHRSKTSLTLAIESAIGGGSLSLIGPEGEIAYWTGPSDRSRAAEELLPQIDQLLSENDIGPSEIGLIAVSAGPGSFTGIRIGVATALGLKSGWDVPLASQSALAAMAFSTRASGELIVAVPAGRSGVCWQRFRKNETGIEEVGEPEAIEETEFVKMSGTQTKSTLILHETLALKYAASLQNVTDFGANVAYAVGEYCRSMPAAIVPPLFVSKTARGELGEPASRDAYLTRS